MKTTLKLTRFELNSLFYSPIAWVLAVIFFIQSGLCYVDIVQRALVNQELGGLYLRNLYDLTYETFGTYSGVFQSVLSKSYLYFPLLTMGLISKEVSSGTIKLLYSAPLRVTQIIFGKFLAMVVYSILLVSILAFFALAGVFSIQFADIGLLASGLLGVFLLLCAYSAIGLFMSSLTSYQIVAGISTLVILGVLNYVGSVWQNIDFVRTLTFFLSISGRTNDMMTGMIDTKDLAYFVIITVMFLAFSIIRLKSKRESISAIRLTGNYLAVFIVALTAGYLTSIPDCVFYFDATADKTQTLTENTQNVVGSLGDAPLEVTSYINLLDRTFSYGAPESRNTDLRRWEPYIRFKPNLRLKYVYYYDMPYESSPQRSFVQQYPGMNVSQIARKFSISYGINLRDYKTPQEISKIIDLHPEQNRYVMQLKLGGKTTFLRLFNDQDVFPSETEICAAFKRLTVQVPKIAFLTGNFERTIDKLGPNDFNSLTSDKTFRYALVNQGFDIEAISAKDSDIPEDIAALVIGDPKVPFTAIELKRIQNYIDRGGNLVIAGEPGDQQILKPLTEPLGVKLSGGILLEKSKDFLPNMVAPFLTDFSAGLSKGLNKAFRDSMGVSMPGVTALQFDKNTPFHIEALLKTSPKTLWYKNASGAIDISDAFFSSATRLDQGSWVTAAAMTRKVGNKEQKIIVTGDTDFLTSSAGAHFGTVNFVFNTALFSWFTNGTFPVDTSRPEAKDNRFKISSQNLVVFKTIALWIIPILMVLYATFFLIRRDRK